MCKTWPLNLKSRVSYGNFIELRLGKLSIYKNFLCHDISLKSSNMNKCAYLHFWCYPHHFIIFDREYKYIWIFWWCLNLFKQLSSTIDLTELMIKHYLMGSDNGVFEDSVGLEIYKLLFILWSLCVFFIEFLFTKLEIILQNTREL